MMSRENWTKGPWTYDYKPGIDSKDKTLWGYAEVLAGEDAILRTDRGEADDIANARLASLSPEMYDVLVEALEYFDDRSDAETMTDRGDVPNDEMVMAEKIRPLVIRARLGNGY